MLFLLVSSCTSDVITTPSNKNSQPQKAEQGTLSARELQDRGDLAAAILAYDSQLAQNPSDISALGNRANLLSISGKNEAALIDYDALLDVDPGNFAAHEKRAALLSEMKSYEKAAQAYDLIIAHRPKSATLFNSRGMALLELGQVQRAKVDFDSALYYQPNWLPALANRGAANYALGLFQAAQQDFQICGDGSPVSINGLGLIAQFVSKDLNLAERKFSEASILFPRDPAAWFNLAFLRAAEMKQEEAIRLFTKVLDLDSLHFDAATNRGLIYMQLKDPEKALTDFDFVAAHLPNQGRPILLKGWAKCEKGEWLRGCLDLADAKSLGEKDAQKLINQYCK